MASARAGGFGRHLSQLFGAGSAVGLTDAELLERFAHRPDGVAEAAFETLLARHGAMVLSVCRQVLGDSHLAEDAFQATFLVVVRRARSLRVRAPGSLGPWLHKVAYRIAWKARQAAARRRAREHRVAVPGVGTYCTAVKYDELRASLHDEVNRLPAQYRAPVVLCYFEGRTHDEAAAALQWPVGTVRGRLARARELLRSRLTRRGLTPGDWVGAYLLAPAAGIEPPARLLEATVAAAINGTPTATVSAMARLMLRGLLLARLPIAGAVLSIALITAGFGLALSSAPAPQTGPRPIPAPAPVSTVPPRSSAVDLFGDPLPKYARARLGGTRFHHGGSLHQALFTPDGTSLVAVDDKGAVRVWDAATGRIIQAIGGPQARFRQVALSPDGQTLATIEDPGQLRTWDLTSGRERRGWHAIPGSYQCLTFSPDGRTVAAGVSIYDQANNTEEKLIYLWDINAPTERRRRFVGDWLDLAGLVFSPDGKTLVSGSNDTESRIVGAKPEKGSTRLWDLATGRERARFPVKGCHVRSVALSPDGKMLAAAVTDLTIRLYNLTTGREQVLRLGQDDELRLKAQAGLAIEPVGPAGSNFMEAMTCLAFSPDGSILASGSSGTGNTGSSLLADVFLWDIARGKAVRHFAAHQGGVDSLTFSPDGKTVASTGSEPMILLWDVATGREAFPQSGHRSWIRTVVISPADGLIFTGGQDGTIRRWDPATGRELGVIASFADPPDPLAIAPDGKTLLVGSHHGGRFGLWSIAERREIRSFPRIEPRDSVHHAVFSPDGKTVASERRIWDCAAGNVLVAFRDPGEHANRKANFYHIFYSPDGKQIITAEREGLRIWDIASSKEVRWPLRSQNFHFYSVALSPDGRFLARGGLENKIHGMIDPAIRLIELASGQEVAALEGHEGTTRALAFSPDGRLIASGSVGSTITKDEPIRVWDLATSREVRRFEGHLAPVDAVSFAPNGRSVISVSEDGTGLVWDLSVLMDQPTSDDPITAEALKARWTELAGDDARAAYRAIWALSVPSAVPFLREHLRPAASADPDGIPAASGPIAPPEVLRTLRAIAALERAGTPEARSVLETLAVGNPGALETRDAKSAIDRLNRRPG